MLIKACLNGSRELGAHPALPLTPTQLADAARNAVAAGAGALHIHPRRADGSWLPAGSGRDQDDVEMLKDLVPDVADSDIFVCGPPAWITSVTRAARRAGAARDQIHTEDFAW